ncbi:hypothetical protein JCM24511_09109 [Saitozyma sp. JCM 24511]|nr:hypothetical protein JCM24511_09109 [Saitozyma sp. JCM 24511]
MAAVDSNPITSAVPSSSPITSVSPYAPAPPLYSAGATNPGLLSRLNLDLRGTIFPVDRETLMLLPESVLLGLFPQGLILSKPATEVGGDDGVFTVDNPLLSKQAIIVLREELEYFSITVPGALARTEMATGMPNEELREMKRQCGKALAERKSIFTALQRNVNKENNLAEQHLIDMLCMSGFSRDDAWGFRACEPTRNIISSMALVLLKTGIVHPGDPEAEQGATQPTVDPEQMATAQKLLLFWRKPARKCWWDGVEVDIPASSSAKGETIKAKVWARRVWTLELSLI